MSKENKEIEWQEGYWALDCDLLGDDIDTIALSREDCFSYCTINSCCNNWYVSYGYTLC
ncbi:MAG: hypothetical protein ACO1G4_06420 [Bacteroidota bacterium]